MIILVSVRLSLGQNTSPLVLIQLRKEIEIGITSCPSQLQMFSSRESGAVQAAMPRVPTVPLASCVDVPVLGFGTGTAWFHNTRGESALSQALHDALNAGFRHIGVPIYILPL